MKNNDIFEIIDSVSVDRDIVDIGHTVHSNSHCNALVENPFAWDDEDVSEK